MADRCVDVIVDWVSTVDHQAVDELHGLGSLTPQLTRHDDLTAFGAALHDEPQNTIARPVKAQSHLMLMFGVMCKEIKLIFSLPWFLLKRNHQTAGTIYHLNPSQTNASVSSNEEDGPLWRTGRNPQNVDLNQWPTEAGSVLFRLVILSSPKGKEPLLSTSPKFIGANTQQIRTPGPVFSFISPPQSVNLLPQYRSILSDSAQKGL